MKEILYRMPSRAVWVIVGLGIISLFMLILPIAACTGPASIPTSAQTQTVTAEPAPAVFQVDGLSVYPAQGYPGQEVIVTATVTNRGGIEGEYTAELKINNAVEETKKATLPAGTSKTLNFSTSRSEAGTYAVALGGLTGQLDVLPQAGLTPGTPGPASSGCCQQTDSSTTPKSGCCGGAGPSTPAKPTTRRGCCGG